MAIDSPFTVGLFAAAALVAMLAATWWGPRLVGSPFRAFLRFMSVVVACVLFATAGAVQQNAVNQWYVTWGSLIGQDDGAATLGQSGALAADLGKEKEKNTVQALGPEPSTFPPLPNPGERIQHYDSVKGIRSGLVGKVDVLLPVSYDHAKPLNYPVIYAMHGTPGSRSAYWGSNFDMRKYFDPLVAAGTVHEVIFVVPQLNFPEGTDSECVNGKAGKPQVEDWLSDDVLGFIGKNLRVQRTSAAWATMGYSAGGYCAAMLGVHHPDKFGAAVMLAGYFHPVWTDSKPQLSADSAAYKKYELVSQIKSNPPALAMLVQMGKKELHNAYEDTKLIQAQARKPFSVTTIVEENTGHSWPFWRKRLPEVAQFLSSSLPPFKGSSR